MFIDVMVHNLVIDEVHLRAHFEVPIILMCHPSRWINDRTTLKYAAITWSAG